jgi:hypothetical protein
MDEAKTERKAIFKQMCKDVDDEKKQLVDSRVEIKEQMK